jgi:hypothetical protein
MIASPRIISAASTHEASPHVSGGMVQGLVSGGDGSGCGPVTVRDVLQPASVKASNVAVRIGFIENPRVGGAALAENVEQGLFSLLGGFRIFDGCIASGGVYLGFGPSDFFCDLPLRSLAHAPFAFLPLPEPIEQQRYAASYERQP